MGGGTRKENIQEAKDFVTGRVECNLLQVRASMSIRCKARLLFKPPGYSIHTLHGHVMSQSLLCL